MSAAFDRDSSPRGWVRRGFRPSAEQCRRLILDHWFDLCARQQRGDTTGVAISVSQLHNAGVFYRRARLREGGQTAALAAVLRDLPAQISVALTAELQRSQSQAPRSCSGAAPAAPASGRGHPGRSTRR